MYRFPWESHKYTPFARSMTSASEQIVLPSLVLKEGLSDKPVILKFFSLTIKAHLSIAKTRLISVHFVAFYPTFQNQPNRIAALPGISKGRTCF